MKIKSITKGAAKNILLGVGGLTILGFGLTMCAVVATDSLEQGYVNGLSASQSTGMDNNTEPFIQQEVQVEPSAAVVALGTEGAITNDRSITVTGSYETDQIVGDGFGGVVEAKGGKLVVVEFTAVNTGMESGDLLFTQLTLVDEQGRSYDTISDFEDIVAVSEWSDNQGYGSKNDQLFPGATVDTVAVFRVAADATDMVMEGKNATFAIQ